MTALDWTAIVVAWVVLSIVVGPLIGQWLRLRRERQENSDRESRLRSKMVMAPQREKHLL